MVYVIGLLAVCAVNACLTLIMYRMVVRDIDASIERIMDKLRKRYERAIGQPRTPDPAGALFWDDIGRQLQKKGLLPKDGE